MPVKVAEDRVVTVGDIATVHRTFKDPEGFARVDGRPALALEVKKRIGRNIIETIEQVRGVVEAERARGRPRSRSATCRTSLATSAPCSTTSATTC